MPTPPHHLFPPRPTLAGHRIAVLLALLTTLVLKTLPASAILLQQDQPAIDPRTHPVLNLGQRAATTRAIASIFTTVIIVEDDRSFLSALQTWTPASRFPILFDDGSSIAHEHNARFVRAYQPQQILRYKVPQDDDTSKNLSLEHIVAQTWSTPQASDSDSPNLPPSLTDHYSTLNHTPLGIVVTDPDDPARLAGAALASAYGQLLITTKLSSNPVGVLHYKRAQAINTQIINAAKASGYDWRALGDDLDAITLCASMPARTRINEKLWVATSDLLGRIIPDTDPQRAIKNAPRWAWASQIMGSTSQTVYAAMCSLFLEPSSAFLFDGYPNSEPWNQYDATLASQLLVQARFKTELFDSPTNSARTWKTRATRSVDAQIILINSKGNADFFDLEPGRCNPGDIPQLQTPAVLHMVHSWSATRPTDRNTVAGRWLERGAFAYIGSVQEPYLQAFVKTPGIAVRMASGVPWGAVGRLWNPATGASDTVWKIATLGDPLWTIAHPGKRISTALPITTNTTSLSADMKQALHAGDYAQALSLLTLMGRDQDALRLINSILAQNALLPASAAQGIPPAFRLNNPDLLITCYKKLSPAQADDPQLRDLLFLTITPSLESTTDLTILGLARQNVRQGQLVADAKAVYKATKRIQGAPAAQAWLKNLINKTPNKKTQTALSKIR